MAGVRAGLLPIHLCHQIHGLSHLAGALRRSLPPAAGAHGSKRGRFSIGPGCWLRGRAGLGRTAELIDAGEQALSFGVELSQLGVLLPWPAAGFDYSCSAALTQGVETQRAKTKRQGGAGPLPPVPRGSEPAHAAARGWPAIGRCTVSARFKLPQTVPRSERSGAETRGNSRTPEPWGRTHWSSPGLSREGVLRRLH